MVQGAFQDYYASTYYPDTPESVISFIGGIIAAVSYRRSLTWSMQLIFSVTVMYRIGTLWWEVGGSLVRVLPRAM